MKVLAFVLSVVIATGFLLAGVIVLVTQVPNQSTGEQILSTFAVLALIYGPLVLGSVAAYWNVRRSEASRRYFARWLWGVGGIEVLAVAGLAVFTALTGAPVWIVITFTAVAAVLNAVSLPVGRWLQRHDEARRPAEPQWQAVASTEIHRKIAKVLITFVVTLVVGVVVLAVVVPAASDGEPLVGEAILIAVEFAFFAASMACLVVSLPLNRRLRGSVNADLGALRTYARVVLRGKTEHLEESERVEAVKYAVLIAIILEFQLAYICLLYAGLVLTQLQIALQGSELSAIILTLLVAILAVLAPFTIVRVRRARAYAAAHADLLPGGRVASPDSV